jgi:hypothetical protein
METKFIKIISAEQTETVQAMAAELKALSDKLAAFRAEQGDNKGMVEEAASFAKMAADNLNEMIERAQPSRRRFSR